MCDGKSEEQKRRGVIEGYLGSRWLVRLRLLIGLVLLLLAFRFHTVGLLLLLLLLPLLLGQLTFLYERGRRDRQNPVEIEAHLDLDFRGLTLGCWFYVVDLENALMTLKKSERLISR